MRGDPVRPLAIIVVNYGSSALLHENLVRSSRAVGPDLVVVVDNRTTDPERSAVRDLADRHGWITVEPSSNLGFGAGVNAGAAVALDRGARDLLLLNPDARIDGEAVDALRAAADADGLSMLAPTIVDGGGEPWFTGADVYLDDGATRGRSQRARFPHAERWEWLTGACLWVPAEAWSLAGGFDESYFLYWEDVDLSRRLVQRGGRIRLVPEAVAVHDEGGTHPAAGRRSREKSGLYYYYNIRNRMLFAVKHLDAAGVARWRRRLLPSAAEVLLRGGRRQFLRPARSMIPAWRAMGDARRIVRQASRSGAAAPHTVGT